MWRSRNACHSDSFNILPPFFERYVLVNCCFFLYKMVCCWCFSDILLYVYAICFMYLHILYNTMPRTSAIVYFIGSTCDHNGHLYLHKKSRWHKRHLYHMSNETSIRMNFIIYVKELINELFTLLSIWKYKMYLNSFVFM